MNEQNSSFNCKQHTCTLHDPCGPENITTKCCRQHREDQVIGHHDKTHRTKNKPTGSYHKQKDAEHFK